VQDELVKLGHAIAASTVCQILHDAGIGLAPRRTGPTWKQFLTTQARGILAVDFAHVDTALLRRIYALIIIGTAPTVPSWPASPQIPRPHGRPTMRTLGSRRRCSAEGGCCQQLLSVTIERDHVE
jgi:hypothetical protein